MMIDAGIESHCKKGGGLNLRMFIRDRFPSMSIRVFVYCCDENILFFFF